MCKSKLKAVGVHFILVGLTILSTYVLLVLFWFPNGLFRVLGGGRLFTLISIIEVTLGPFLTFVVYSTRKTQKELFFDFSIVAILQFSVFSYGLYSAYISRPVLLVFSIDRIEILSKADFSEDNESDYRMFMPSLFSFPTLVSVHLPESDSERTEILFESLMGGEDLHFRPSLYEEYSTQEIIQKIRPLDILIQKMKEHGSSLTEDIVELNSEVYGWLPAHSYSGFSTAIINMKTGFPIEFVDFDAL